MPAQTHSYLVIGSTGKTGLRVAKNLEAHGLDVRGVSRSTEIRFDWNDPDTWPAALEGITRAYVTYSPDLAVPGAVETVDALVDAAVEAGVQRIVLLSGRGEEEAQRAEKTIQREGLEWTVVRAGWFAQNFSEGPFAEMVADGTIYLPAGEVKEPFIDVDDLSAVATAALIEDGHAGEVYEVTGPRLMTFEDVASEISEAAGREVRFQQIPIGSFRAGLEEAGLPDGVAWLMEYLFTHVLDGRNEYVADGVERALGRPATDFREYAARVANAGAWEVTA